jgi:hypothetical protein
MNLKTNFICNTDGKGLWSKRRKAVTIHEIALTYTDSLKTHGELIAAFQTKEWDIERDGLIYTDNTWLSCFREHLKGMGFSSVAANDVDYSEQGMQGDNFVSMDVGETFLKEWHQRA